MLGIYDASLRLKPPYRPSDFRKMVVENGGKEAADILLAPGPVSTGFTQLYMRGKEALKLSVEYLVLQHPWKALCHPDQLAIARQRLVDVGCDLPLDEASPEPT